MIHERTSAALRVTVFDRAMGWLLPAVAVVTPFIVITGLERPTVAQGYFLQLAVMLLLALHGLAMAVGWRRFSPRLNLAGWLLLLNFAILLFSVLKSGQQLYMLFSLKKFLLPGAGILFGWMLASHPMRRVVLRRTCAGLAGAAVALSIYGIMQFFGFELFETIRTVTKSNVTATIGHPNFLGSVLGPMMFVTLGFAFRRRGLTNIIAYSLACFLMLFCLGLAQTRGVWLGVAMGTITFSWMGVRHAMRDHHARPMLRAFGAGLGATLLALIVGLLLIVPLFSPQLNLLDRLTSSNEIKSRLFYWSAAIDLARGNPVLGVGYARFDARFWDYALAQQQSEMGPFYVDFIPAVAGQTPEHVHNEYLQVLCEQGFVGLAALLALVCFFLYFGYHALMRERHPARALQNFAIYGAFVCSLVDALFAFPWRLPVSLIVFIVVVTWLYDSIFPGSSAPPDVSAAPSDATGMDSGNSSPALQPGQ